MKPHLPVSLFRALLTAVVAFPVFTYASESDIPADFERLILSKPSDIDKGQSAAKVAFRIESPSTTDTTIRWIETPTYFGSQPEKEVLFTRIDSSEVCNMAILRSGRFMSVGDISFVDISDFTLNNNNYSASNNANSAYNGGILSVGGLKLSGAGALEGFNSTDHKILLERNRNLSVTYNSMSVSGENVKIHGMGAVMGAAHLEITQNKDITISQNKLSVNTTGNAASAKSIAYGGSLFGEDVIITNNDNVLFESNKIRATSAGQSEATGAAIGALNSITITGNDSVVFRGNAICCGSAYYLESLGIKGINPNSNSGALTVSAANSRSVIFYDPINVRGNVSFNSDFTDEYGQQQKAEGEIIFSAEDLEKHLTTARQELGADQPEASDKEKYSSKKSLALGNTTLHNGILLIQKDAIYSTGSFTAESGSTLKLNKGSLWSKDLDTHEQDIRFQTPATYSGDRSITFESGSNLHIQDTGNNIKAEDIRFAGNNTITFDISPSSTTTACITIEEVENLTFGTGITILLTSDTSVTRDEYKLISIDKETKRNGWTDANITVASGTNLGFTATFSNLFWREIGNRMELCYSTDPYILKDGTWNNNNGDFVWSLNSINWSENGQNYSFANGAHATFTDTGAGTITIQGNIAPASVVVNNTAAGTYEWKADSQGGKLTGEMQLTKKGEGELKISLANDYSGGTIVEGGTLIAGDAQAFGTGAITVTGGHLNTDTYSVTNDVTLQGGKFSGTAYNGKLSAIGTIAAPASVSIGDNTTAQSVDLKNVTISGGSFTGKTNISSSNATIETLLTGETNLTVTGNTTLVGNHNSTGTFTVQSGQLILAELATTTADLDLQGGYLTVSDDKLQLNIGQSVKLNGGSVQGTLETAVGSTVEVIKDSTVTGLNLNGGTYIATTPDVTLQVGGDLNILGNTKVDVSSFIETGSYTLISAGEIKGETSKLTAVTDNRNTFVFEKNNNDLELTVQENAADLYWKAGQTGEWGTGNTQQWDTTADDKRFFNRDKVNFNEGGKVELVSDVTPASVVVTGDKDVTLSGAGSITGSTTTLTKDGDCVLNMNAANSYEGGTVIENGTINAGGVDSFGKGSIQLKGGTLNMRELAAANAVEATGGEFIGTAYSGTLTVKGDLSVGDKTTAGEIALKSGSISQGSISNTAIIADGGDSSIASKLKGTTSLRVDKGTLTLDCENESSGTVTVNDGNLIITGTAALGKGDIYLNGGKMLMNPNADLILTGKQKLNLRGGQLVGNARTGNATSIVVSKDSTIDGNLDLNGGTIYFEGKDKEKPATRSMIIGSNGCTLSVTGALTLRADTLIYLEKGQYADGDILLEADSLTGDFSQLILNYDDGNPNTEFALELQQTEDAKVQIILDLDKVYEHENSNWVIADADLRDLLVQSNWGMFASSHAFTDALQGQRSASGTVGSHGVMVWASGLYSHMSVNDDGAMNGGDSDTMGAAVGIETMVGSRSCIGLAVGVTSTDISVGGISDEMEQDGIYFGIYGATVLSRLSEISGLTLSWSAAYGSVESSPSGAASSIEWQQDSFQLNGRVDWSRSVSHSTTVNVFAGLEYFMTTSDEVAGVDSGEIRNLRAELGAGITRRYSSSVLYAEARLLGDIMRDDPTPTIDGWSEEGANPGTVGAGFRVGAAYDINQFWSIGANGSVEIMGDAVSAGANIGASLKF